MSERRRFNEGEMYQNKIQAVICINDLKLMMKEFLAVDEEELQTVQLSSEGKRHRSSVFAHQINHHSQSNDRSIYIAGILSHYPFWLRFDYNDPFVRTKSQNEDRETLITDY